MSVGSCASLTKRDFCLCLDLVVVEQIAAETLGSHFEHNCRRDVLGLLLAPSVVSAAPDAVSHVLTRASVFAPAVA